MLVKIMFIVISYSVSLTSIFAIANLKPQTDDIKRSSAKAIIFYLLSAIVDFILFLIVVICFIPIGEYGTGIELLVVIVNLAIFLPIYLHLGKITYKKFEVLCPNRTDIKSLKSLWKTVIVKTMFLLAVTIWILEV